MPTSDVRSQPLDAWPDALPDASLLEADASAWLPLFPALAPVPPPPFHPARSVRGQPDRDQATLLSPASHLLPAGHLSPLSPALPPGHLPPVSPAPSLTVREEVRREQRQIEQWKDEFLSLVSHELRTPLTPIKGFTQHLLRRAERKLAEATSQGGEGQARLVSSVRYEQHCLEIIQSEAEHLERLVNTLLDVSLLRRGKLQLQLCSCDLIELVEQVVRSVQRAAEQQEIILHLLGEHLLVRADRERLQVILGNLLENALKYAAAGEMVQVSVLEHEQECVVSVGGQGEGRASEQVARLFERVHHSASSGARLVEEVGVSWYHAQAILQLHGGRIWAERHAREAGANFALVLPRQPAATDVS